MSIDYTNKWVRQILELQHDDGSWGCFHTLSQPTKKQPMTTEQALRRLRILGLTKEDEPIQRALMYIRSCLSGERQIPDRREKVINWDAFEAHMFATWLRLFDPDDPQALPIARFWADIIAYAFQDGTLNMDRYSEAYRERIPKLNPGERMISISQFYMVNLLQGMLDAKTEAAFVDHIINNEDGIYYIYGGKISDLPAEFASKQTNYYLSALEQLAGFSCAGEKLKFAVDWICRYRDENGQWDLGPSVKDGVYFPLSDSWRKPEDRKRDCAFRINKLLKQLSKS
ncbi:MAG: hypothetical protein GX193_08145 [Clostridiales bacterium]|nr:hypothetical protein [Clostridiales bacterium]